MLIAPALLVLGGFGCADDPPGEQAVEPVARAPLAVQNGTVDTTNKYNYVVGLRRVEDAIPFCSGTLVSRWVLSARHCFTNPNIDFEVVFGFDADETIDPLPQLVIKHTAVESGPVLLRLNKTLDPYDNEDIAQDFAVFRLDKRVPVHITKPLHPPIHPGDPKCGSDITATLVGYGGGAWSCPNPDHRYRRYGTASGWLRADLPPEGALFSNTWYAPFSICDEYDGITEGDSGGLLMDLNGRMCGVISSHTIEPMLLPPYGFSTARTSPRWTARPRSTG